MVDTLDFIKIRNFFTSKDTIKKTIGQTMDKKKIFVMHVSDKRLASKLYK